MKNFIFLCGVFLFVESMHLKEVLAADNCSSDLNSELNRYYDQSASKQAHDQSTVCIESFVKNSSIDSSTKVNALLVAVKNNDPKLSKILLDLNVNPNTILNTSGPFLEIFGGAEHDDRNELIQTFANSQKLSKKELSMALSYCTFADHHLAPVRFNLNNVQALVENGADVNYKDDGKTILDQVKQSCDQFHSPNKSDELATCLSMKKYLEDHGAYTSNDLVLHRLHDHLKKTLENCGDYLSKMPLTL